MIDRKPLRNDAAERQAYHVRAIELEVVEQLDEVDAQIRDAAWLPLRRGAPHAAVISQDQREVSSQFGNDGIPTTTGHPQPRDEQQRVALSQYFVIATNVSEFRPRHRVRPH